ncbi:MAG: aminotransferase class I/II-fold pyridoxal phosphate-dependent enzyme [Alphaproteobacteria bacterium]|nr:aminotransferase class I/II-fold pyridoxal phosphate-dependent enzyme [Alphaproteobacteria bacterium]
MAKMDNQPPLLTLPEDDMRRMAEKVFGLIVDHFAGLKDLPVTTPSTLEHITEGLHEPMPTQAVPVEQLLAQLKTHVFDQMTHLDHPRYFAFVPGPSNFVSAMADAIASSFNVFSGAFIGPSGVAQIEVTTIEWLRELFRFPQDAGGLFVSGGSMANMTGLAVARHVMLAGNTTNATVYFSDQTHSSVAKGLKILGFQQFQLRKIASDATFRLSVDALRQQIATDRLQGLVPFCVVANAGTTNAGAADPIKELSAFCKAEGLWLHVDGAYGGSAAITERGRKVLEGIELADSLGIDPHKWMFQPYEIGCVLVRNREHLKNTFRFSAEYLKLNEQCAEQINFCDYGVQLTRGFRALKLWLSLKAFGVDAFRAAITKGIENAEIVESLLRNGDCWEIITPAQLGIITFRYRADGLDESALNELNNHIAQDIIYSGYAMLSPTILGGKHVLRMCTINPRTTHDDLKQTVGMLKSFGEHIEVKPTS